MTNGPLLVSKLALKVAGACSVNAAGFLSFDIFSRFAACPATMTDASATPARLNRVRFFISLLESNLKILDPPIPKTLNPQIPELETRRAVLLGPPQRWKLVGRSF